MRGSFSHKGRGRNKTIILSKYASSCKHVISHVSGDFFALTRCFTSHNRLKGITHPLTQSTPSHFLLRSSSAHSNSVLTFPKTRFQLVVPLLPYDVQKNLTDHMLHLEGPPTSQINPYANIFLEMYTCFRQNLTNWPRKLVS